MKSRLGNNTPIGRNSSKIRQDFINNKVNSPSIFTKLDKLDSIEDSFVAYQLSTNSLLERILDKLDKVDNIAGKQTKLENLVYKIDDLVKVSKTNDELYKTDVATDTAICTEIDVKVNSIHSKSFIIENETKHANVEKRELAENIEELNHGVKAWCVKEWNTADSSKHKGNSVFTLENSSNDSTLANPSNLATVNSERSSEMDTNIDNVLHSNSLTEQGSVFKCYGKNISSKKEAVSLLAVL